VDYTKEVMDDDEDGVVDSHVILPNRIMAATTDHNPIMTSGPVARINDTLVHSRDLDVHCDLVLVKLKDPLQTTAARVGLSSGADHRRVVGKRDRNDAFGDARPRSVV
jgi:hypothetical protein